jgi:hypothetical protein
MATVHLLGRVLPGEPRISLNEVFDAHWIAEEFGGEFVFNFKMTVKDSNIDIACEFPGDYKSDYLAEIYRRSFDICPAAVNLAAFQLGFGWTIVFEHFVNSEGIQTPLTTYDPALAQICTAYSLQEGFNEIFRFVFSQPILIRHLSDLITAMTVPHEAPMSCARAMDGLKHLIAKPDSSDSAAWHQMRAALRADKAYLQFITECSKPGRHGKNIRVPGDITRQAIIRAWTIMNRYFEFVKRGSVALPEAEFPTLTG